MKLLTLLTRDDLSEGAVVWTPEDMRNKEGKGDGEREGSRGRGVERERERGVEREISHLYWSASAGDRSGPPVPVSGDLKERGGDD